MSWCSLLFLNTIIFNIIIFFSSTSSDSCVGKTSLFNRSGFITDESFGSKECIWIVNTHLSNYFVNFTISSYFHSVSDRISFHHSSPYSPSLVSINSLQLDSKVTFVVPTDNNGILIIFYSIHAHEFYNLSLFYDSFNCPFNCHNRGECLSTIGQCKCYANIEYNGKYCQRYTPHDDRWIILQSIFNNYSSKNLNKLSNGQVIYLSDMISMQLPSPSAGHSSVLINNDQIVTFGGYGGQQLLTNEPILLQSFNLSSFRWSLIDTKSFSSSPPCLYQHSVNYWPKEQLLLIYGGLYCASHSISPYLWIWNSSAMTWTSILLSLKQPQAPEEQTKTFYQAGGLSVYSHEAHIISKKNQLLIMFGLTATHQFYKCLQWIDLTSLPEMLLNFKLLVQFDCNNSDLHSLLFHGFAQFASVLDEKHKCIWFHGGINSPSLPLPSLKTKVSSRLIAFYFLTNQWSWSLYPNSLQPRFGHSMLLIENKLLLIGGLDDSMKYVKTIEIFQLDNYKWISLADANALHRYAATVHFIQSKQFHGLLILGGYLQQSLQDVFLIPLNCSVDIETNDTLSSAICYHSPSSSSSSTCFGLNCNYCSQFNQNCYDCLLLSGMNNTHHQCAWNLKDKQCQFRNVNVNETDNEQIIFIHENNDNLFDVIQLCSCDHDVEDCSREIDPSSSSSLFTRPANNTAQAVANDLCSQQTDCNHCLSMKNGRHDCLWCESQARCYSSDIFYLNNIMNQCTRFIHSIVARCPYKIQCHEFHTCRECNKHIQCGWCADYSQPFDGVGKCVIGSLSAPLSFNSQFNHFVVNASLCPFNTTTTATTTTSVAKVTNKKYQWFYQSIDCPQCQCHGFGICANKTNKSLTQIINESQCYCYNYTRGRECEQCKDGYYGNPKLHVHCKACQCADHKIAYNCSSSGSCNDYCLERGASGHSCEMCDASFLPWNGHCYWDVKPGNEFTIQPGQMKQFPLHVRYAYFLFRLPEDLMDASIDIHCIPPYFEPKILWNLSQSNEQIINGKVENCHDFILPIGQYKNENSKNVNISLRISGLDFQSIATMNLTIRFNGVINHGFVTWLFPFIGLVFGLIVIVFTWKFIICCRHRRGRQQHTRQETQLALRALSEVNILITDNNSKSLLSANNLIALEPLGGQRSYPDERDHLVLGTVLLQLPHHQQHATIFNTQTTTSSTTANHHNNSSTSVSDSPHNHNLAFGSSLLVIPSCYWYEYEDHVTSPSVTAFHGSSATSNASRRNVHSIFQHFIRWLNGWWRDLIES